MLATWLLAGSLAQVGFGSFFFISRYSDACVALGQHRAVAGFIAQSAIKKVSN